jgi:hypothetical protein
MEINHPKSVKPEMRGHSLRSGVNCLGALIKKTCKTKWM